MTHVHFDLGAVERQMRASHEHLMASANLSDESKAMMQRFLQPTIDIMIEAVKLRNEGVSARNMGAAIGSAVGNMLANASAASGNPNVFMALAADRLGFILREFLKASQDENNPGIFTVVGQTGGRA